MIRRLHLPPAQREQILSAAREAGQRECCGLIEGVRDGEAARALALHPARNLAGGRDRFELDPQDQFDALRAARARGHAIIGCYHSHPGGRARPSATDLAGAGEEDFLWLIAGASSGEDWGLAAFVYRGGEFFGLPTGADCVTSSW
jgi:proteasome lid subunit RPN8/RPN11